MGSKSLLLFSFALRFTCDRHIHMREGTPSLLLLLLAIARVWYSSHSLLPLAPHHD
jgi:hypothetical protein